MHFRYTHTEPGGFVPNKAGFPGGQHNAFSVCWRSDCYGSGADKGPFVRWSPLRAVQRAARPSATQACLLAAAPRAV